MITVLCLACMLFTVIWSVHAAMTQKRPKLAKPVGASDSSVARDDASGGEDTGNAAENNAPAAETESAAPSAEPENEIAPTAPVKDYSVASDTEDQLADAVFIGDSRTVGLMNVTDKPQAYFLCAVGLNIDTALTDNGINLGSGLTGTIPQGLAGKSFGRVFISFGTNEMGWPYIDVFKEHYSKMVSQIMALQPDAEIYLIGILPVTRSKDAMGESVNNQNAKLFTQAISEVADELGVHYLDCSDAVADSWGYLPEEASTDGVHMSEEYLLRWQNYIIDNT